MTVTINLTLQRYFFTDTWRACRAQCLRLWLITGEKNIDLIRPNNTTMGRVSVYFTKCRIGLWGIFQCIFGYGFVLSKTHFGKDPLTRKKKSQMSECNLIRSDYTLVTNIETLKSRIWLALFSFYVTQNSNLKAMTKFYRGESTSHCAEKYGLLSSNRFSFSVKIHICSQSLLLVWPIFFCLFFSLLQNLVFPLRYFGFPQVCSEHSGCLNMVLLFWVKMWKKPNHRPMRPSKCAFPPWMVGWSRSSKRSWPYDDFEETLAVQPFIRGRPGHTCPGSRCPWWPSRWSWTCSRCSPTPSPL